jgi:uncharacterized protein (TIGR04255 family)
MAQIRPLSRPPIREAILEFQIAPMVDISIEELEQWEIPSTYSALKIKKSSDAQPKRISDFPSGENSTTHLIVGGISQDSKQNIAVQIMRNRLTVNKLAPYTNFNSLKEETQTFWEQYQRKLNPEKIQRVGLRYINEISLSELPEHYLLREFVPQGKLAAQAIRSYQRYEIRRAEEQIAGLVQIIIENESKRLFIDIDLFSERLYQANDALVWSESVEQLHSLKNDLFFSTITEEYAKECE